MGAQSKLSGSLDGQPDWIWWYTVVIRQKGNDDELRQIKIPKIKCLSQTKDLVVNSSSATLSLFNQRALLFSVSLSSTLTLGILKNRRLASSLLLVSEHPLTRHRLVSVEITLGKILGAQSGFVSSNASLHGLPVHRYSQIKCCCLKKKILV